MKIQKNGAKRANCRQLFRPNWASSVQCSTSWPATPANSTVDLRGLNKQRCLKVLVGFVKALNSLVNPPKLGFVATITSTFTIMGTQTHPIYQSRYTHRCWACSMLKSTVYRSTPWHSSSRTLHNGKVIKLTTICCWLDAYYSSRCQAPHFSRATTVIMPCAIPFTLPSLILHV